MAGRGATPDPVAGHGTSAGDGRRGRAERQVDPDLVRRVAGDPAARPLRRALALAKVCGDPPGPLARAVLAARLPNVAAALEEAWPAPAGACRLRRWQTAPE